MHLEQLMDTRSFSAAKFFLVFGASSGLTNIQMWKAEMQLSHLARYRAANNEDNKWSNFKTYAAHKKLTESELKEIGDWLQSMSLEQIITNKTFKSLSFPMFVDRYVNDKELRQQLQKSLYDTYSVQAFEEMSQILLKHKSKREWDRAIISKILQLSKLIPLDVMKYRETTRRDTPHKPHKPIYSLIKFYILDSDVKEELLGIIFDESGEESDEETDENGETDNKADTTKGNYEKCQSFKKECEDERPPIKEPKKCYRKLSLKYHPDRNRSPDATEKMQTLNSCFTESDSRMSWVHSL